MVVEKTVRGFLGFDACNHLREWNQDEIETLQIVTDTVSTALSRKLLTDQLKESEENFRGFFNTVDDMIFIIDLKGRILYANDGACRKLSYKINEIIGMPVQDLHPAEKRAEAKRMLQALFKEKTLRTSLELISSDGRHIPVENRIWFGEWNSRKCMFSISRDLSAEQSALQKFERLFRSNPAAMAVIRIEDSTFFDVNDAFVELFGYSREDVVGISNQSLDLFVDHNNWLSIKEELIRNRSIRNHEITLHSKNGHLINGLFSGNKISGQDQDFFLTIMVDITRQIQLQREIELSRLRFFKVIEGTRLGTWEWNIQTNETIFNERWAEIVGYSLSELEPTNLETWKDLVHPEDLSEVQKKVNAHVSGATDYYECEMRIRHKNGNWIWILDRGKVIEWDDQGRPFKMYGTHTDITDRKAMEEQIKELAIRDPLTNIYNRRYLFRRLDDIAAEYSRQGRNFCVSIIDIDHFKHINDTYGHLAGDCVLKEFIQTISATTRQYDLIGRYGGEEFIIVSPGAEKKDVAVMFERIMARIRKKFFVHHGHKIHLTFSCGIADSSEFPREEFSSETIVSLADKRMYQAKAEGRNRCVGI